MDPRERRARDEERAAELKRKAAVRRVAGRPSARPTAVTQPSEPPSPSVVEARPAVVESAIQHEPAVIAEPSREAPRPAVHVHEPATAPVSPAQTPQARTLEPPDAPVPTPVESVAAASEAPVVATNEASDKEPAPNIPNVPIGPSRGERVSAVLGAARRRTASVARVAAARTAPVLAAAGRGIVTATRVGSRALWKGTRATSRVVWNGTTATARGVARGSVVVGRATARVTAATAAASRRAAIRTRERLAEAARLRSIARDESARVAAQKRADAMVAADVARERDAAIAESLATAAADTEVIPAVDAPSSLPGPPPTATPEPQGPHASPWRDRFVRARDVVGATLSDFGRFLGIAARAIRDAVLRLLRRLRAIRVGRPGRRPLVIAGAAVGSLLVAYVIAQAAVAGSVASGTTVLGVDVGGMPRELALETLTDAFGQIEESAVLVSAHDGLVSGLPSELGLELDAAATLDSLTGFSWSPSNLWAHAFGSGEATPVVRVDDDALGKATSRFAAELNREPIDGRVELADGVATAVAGQDGVTVDPEEMALTLVASWPSPITIEVPSAVVAANISTDEAERFARALNGVVLASDVTMSGPSGSVVLTPDDVWTAGTVVENGAHLALEIDATALADVIRARAPGLENGAINASYAFDSSHMLYIDAGAPARALDIVALGDATVLAVTSVSRTGALPFVETPQEVTTDELGVSDFKERVSSFSTPFIPHETQREKNIANAARRLSGTIVEPGEIFSLTEAIGPIEASAGYVSAGVIVGGVHTTGIGGGLSQMATTSYNAGYFAGLEDVEHRPHTEWFERYPAGREATIHSSLDMRFRNDTPYRILINSYVADKSIYVDIWSTPYYTVESTSSGHYNVRSPGTTTVYTEPCRSSSSKTGFTVTDYRKVYLDGVLVKDEARTWTYRSISGTRCG